MTLKLYKTIDKREKLNKTLTNETIVSGTLKNKVSVINPTILLHNVNLSFTDFNYCYITEFDRYYFIDDLNIENASLFELKLSEDVLMSFNADIKKMTVEVTHSSIFNTDKVECETTDKKTLTNTINLLNPFSENGYLYMTTIKGV